MKCLVSICFLLLAICSCYAADSGVAFLPANYGEVVFVRQESMGKLNIVRASITCNMWERLAIGGGEATAVYLSEGTYEFQAFSSEPYDDSSDRTSCRSAALKVKVTKGKKLFIQVIPEMGDEKTSFSWTLKEKTNKSATAQRP